MFLVPSWCRDVFRSCLLLWGRMWQLAHGLRRLWLEDSSPSVSSLGVAGDSSAMLRVLTFFLLSWERKEDSAHDFPILNPLEAGLPAVAGDLPRACRTDVQAPRACPTIEDPSRGTGSGS